MYCTINPGEKEGHGEKKRGEKKKPGGGPVRVGRIGQEAGMGRVDCTNVSFTDGSDPVKREKSEKIAGGY